MILLIDNYDSFTYNLYQYIGEINPDVQVLRNDALTLDEMKGMDLDCIILSPGPGVPEDSRSTILQPFKRLDGSRNRESGGAGLGLAIVSSIVNAHRGRIEILEADIGGAAFRTWWPLSGN